MSEPEADWHTGAVIISDQLGCRIRLGQGTRALPGCITYSASSGDLRGAKGVGRYGSWRRLRLRYDSNLKPASAHTQPGGMSCPGNSSAHVRASPFRFDG